jgi:hypothetical protein
MFKTAGAKEYSEGLDKRLLEVVQQAYTCPFSLQSDFARSNAFFVAAASSLGYITTRTAPRSLHYGHLWRTTASGLTFLSKE